MTQALHMDRRDEARLDRRLGFTAVQRKRIATGVLLSYLCYPGVVLAQTVVEGGGAHAPQITQSQNNTTVVNINRASAAGVSRNQYNQFNVGPKGLILNNSTAITQTQLAGYIDGNAALKGQAARIILNEVVSANPSALRGYTEIAGQRAEFILANPNGISCNGCGFINTTRSTLTTGTAQFNANGGITGFRVEGGQIAIEGQGLNASNVDQLDLLSRTIRINGELWAKQLNLVTGRNVVDHASLAATPLSDPAGVDPAATGVALDVSAIGGMYANVIRMVGTEKGFGVNSQGQMIAEKDFTLAADGRITHGGAMNAGGKLTVSTQEALDNQGFIGGGQVSLTARSVDNSAQAVLLADRQLNITAQEQFSNEGGVQATDIAVQAGQMRNGAQGILFAENVLRIDSAGTVDNQGALIAGGTVGALGLKARNFNNTAGGVLLSFGDADIVVEETLLNESSTIEAAGDLKLQAANIRNTRETFDVQARVTTKKYNNIAIGVSGKYKSGTRSYTETITTHEVTANSAAGQILSGGDLTLLGRVDNIYSTISAGGDLHVEGAVLNNQDYVVVDSNVHAGTDTLKYDKKVCDIKVAGKCVSSHKETRTDTRSYNNTSNTQVTLASATFSAGRNLTGQVGELKNGMRIDALAQPQAPGAPDGAALPNWALGDAGYKLPTSGLVKPSNAPNGAYLVETDPRLTSYKDFISSDYMLSRMDYDPSITVKRLGDGFVEQRLVRDQLLSQTGQQNIAGFTDLEQQYVWLMQNAVSQSEALSLSMGIALSPEQISQLQAPIVWMVWETFETANGPEKALVPKVYLGSLGDGTDMELRPDGALIAAGGAMSLTVAGKLENNGSLQAGSLNVDAGEILNKGDIRAEGDMALSTEGDLVNQGGVIAAGGALGLEVGGDLVNETQAQRIANETRTSRTNAWTGEVREEVRSDVQTLVGREASISGGSVTINVGGDVRMTAANLSAQEQLSLTAGGDVEFKALETLTANSSRNYRVSETEQLTNEIQAGGAMTIQSGGKLLSEGTSFQAGGDMALAAQEVELAAVTSSSESYLRMDQGMSGKSTSQQSSTTVVGNELAAGGSLSISSGSSIVSTASTLAAGGTLSLAAEGDVLLMAATERDYSYEKESKDSNSFGGGSKKTTHAEESLSTVGNQLSGQDIQIQSGGLVHVHASTLDAEQDITIKAENIALTAGIDQEYERQTKESTTAVKVKSQDKGSMEQTAVATSLSGTNINILATGGVQITASNLNAEENLAIGNVAVQQQADGSFVAVNGEGTPENLIVDTLALKSESWNEKSEGYRGIAADLMKGFAVVAGSIAQSMDMEAPEIKLGSSSGQKTTTTTQQSSTLSAGEQLVLAAQNNVTLIGAEVSTEGTAVLSGKNVTLEAAAETSTSETSRSEHTVGGMGGKLNKDEVSLGGMKEVKTTETTTTTSTTHKGTTLSAGNLAVLATQDVNLVASQVEVEGQAIVQAGGDVNVTGKQDTTSSETRTEVETTTVAVAVRNAYVDAAMAAKALKDAYDAAKDADKAYDEAKKRVKDGDLAKAALKDYEINRDMARVAVVQAEIAAAAALKGAAVTAAQSGSTGFYVSGSAQKEVTTTSTAQTASIWQGSSIDAGSLVISGKNTTIEGSDITAGWLKLDSDNVLITAGVNQYKTETSSSTKSVSASGGTNGSAGASASTSSSKSSSTSLQNFNSTINVGHLESNADSFTLRGAEVTANTADLNVGSLTVQSLQDTSSSSNSSKSTSVGVSNSTSKNGSSQSANVGVNRSNGSSEAQEVGNQTQLLIADGANSQITAKDTTLIGGLIANATKNEDGTLTDHGKLNLTTETLTVSDLKDKSESEQSGWGFQTSTGRSADKKGDNVSYGGSGTTTVSMSKEGHKKEGETQATLGQGNIKVGGSSLDDQEQYADLNRNVNEGQITTLDLQTGGLNSSLSMDNRFLTSAGLESLWRDQVELGKNSLVVANAAGKDMQWVGNKAGQGIHYTVLAGTILLADEGNVVRYSSQIEDKIDTYSLGLIPTTLNNGGFFTQVPVTLGADDINQRRIVAVSENSQYMQDHPDLGWVSITETQGYQLLSDEQKTKVTGLMVSTRPVEITAETSTFQNATNGMLNTVAKALYNGLTQTHDMLGGASQQDIQFTLNYNPTRGVLADAIESGVDKVSIATGAGFLATSMARETASFVNNVMLAQGDKGANFAMHSQANLLTYSGLQAGGANQAIGQISSTGKELGTSLDARYTFASYGSPVNSDQFNTLLSKYELTLSVSSVNAGDFVGERLGGNQGVYVSGGAVGGQVNVVNMNQDGTLGVQSVPVIDLKSTITSQSNASLWVLKGDKSPHSNYSCLGRCGPAGVSTGATPGTNQRGQ